jgi:hypothetical protein
MRHALDSAGHHVPRTKPTCLLHTCRPHRQRPFALVLNLHQHQSSCNLHLQYLAKNQSTQRCQSLITQGSDHPPVLEPHLVLNITVLDAFHLGGSTTSDRFSGLHQMNIPLRTLYSLDDPSIREKSTRLKARGLRATCPLVFLQIFRDKIGRTSD